MQVNLVSTSKAALIGVLGVLATSWKSWTCAPQLDGACALLPASLPTPLPAPLVARWAAH